MAIEFSCPNCQARIRTPDHAAGKSARCPQCGGVSIVPGTPSAYATVVATQPQPPNPFADQPPAPTPVNPYAPPEVTASQQWQPAAPKEQARARLIIPAIGMIVFALLGLSFMGLAGIGMAANPKEMFPNVEQDPAGRAGAVGFIVAYFTVGFLSRIVQLLGAIAMLRVRGYSLAMAGAICAIIPCDVYCCLPCFPLGIWALIALNSAQVKAAFA